MKFLSGIPMNMLQRTSRKKGKKRKQHPEQVSAIVIESKPVSKVNGDLKKSIVNLVFRFRHTKRTPQIKRNSEDGRKQKKI
ncbi:hypothetical protein ACTXT7_012229 [Hymenolepis weldensis]